MTFRPVPKPVFPKKHMVTDIPEHVKEEVNERSHNQCEAPECPDRKGDVRGLVYAHNFEYGARNKGMGGTRRVPTANDIKRYCWPCHLKLDHHIRKG